VRANIPHGKKPYTTKDDPRAGNFFLFFLPLVREVHWGLKTRFHPAP